MELEKGNESVKKLLKKAVIAERGFGSSVKETLFFLIPFFPSIVIARVFGAISFEIR